jgi:hypothetical protein
VVGTCTIRYTGEARSTCAQAQVTFSSTRSARTGGANASSSNGARRYGHKAIAGGSFRAIQALPA